MKKIKILILIIFIFALIMPIITYATETTNLFTKKEEISPLTVDKTEVSVGDTVNLVLDLEKVVYEDFHFTLSSNQDLGEIKTDAKEINEKITTTNKDLEMDVNKEKLNLNTISFLIEIPENLSIGSKITLTGTLRENIESTENEKIEGNIVEGNLTTNQISTINEIENRNDIENTEKLPEETEIVITLTIVEKEEQESKEDKVETNRNEAELEQNTNNKNSNSGNQSQTKGTISVGGMQNSSQTASTVYQGESNYYLSSLSINGYEILPAFSKTTHTYFLTIPNHVEELNISAVAEDSEAKVRIYGNDNLTEGENKVLIYVTAENGEVKLYRIYVTKES